MIDWNKIFTSARNQIDRDPTLAIYTVRDYEATEKAGLRDLAWSYTKEYATFGEARAFLDELEKYINEHPEASQ